MMLRRLCRPWLTGFPKSPRGTSTDTSTGTSTSTATSPKSCPTTEEIAGAQAAANAKKDQIVAANQAKTAYLTLADFIDNGICPECAAGKKIMVEYRRLKSGGKTHDVEGLI